MDTLKKTEVLITTANTALLFGIGIYFYRQNSAVKGDISILSDHLSNALTKIGDMQKYESHIGQLAAATKDINRSVTEMKVDVNDLYRRMGNFIDAVKEIQTYLHSKDEEVKFLEIGGRVGRSPPRRSYDDQRRQLYPPQVDRGRFGRLDRLDQVDQPRVDRRGGDYRMDSREDILDISRDGGRDGGRDGARDGARDVGRWDDRRDPRDTRDPRDSRDPRDMRDPRDERRPDRWEDRRDPRADMWDSRDSRDDRGQRYSSPPGNGPRRVQFEEPARSTSSTVLTPTPGNLLAFDGELNADDTVAAVAAARSQSGRTQPGQSHQLDLGM